MNIIRCITCFLTTILLCTVHLYAQNEQDTIIPVTEKIPEADNTTAQRKDSLVIQPAPSFMTPKKTAFFSAIVPGLGQIQNKHYWKVPVIYVGVGVTAYFLYDNITNYNLYRKLYAGFRNNNKDLINSTPYNESQVTQLKDYYRRNLDLTVLLSALGYALQIVDAVVYAHLKDFDISEDISFNARPVVMPQGGLGVGLVLRF